MIVRILMIDDHPVMIEGYKAMLALNKEQYGIETISAFNCEEAYNLIINPANSTAFDLVFLDYSIPRTSIKKGFVLIDNVNNWSVPLTFRSTILILVTSSC